MAARRLIFVMIGLLLASSVAAALVPIPEDTTEEPATTTQPTATRTGELLERTLSADARKPGRIRAEVGDALALTVTGSLYGLVEITGLGQVEDLDPNSPARFDLLLRDPGSYAVHLTESRRPIGRIKVVPGKRR